MQQAVQVQTIVDEKLVQAIPALEPFLGHRVQVIALDLSEADKQKQADEQEQDKISFDEFLKHRLKRPNGVPPVTLEDMERAIIKGALDGNV